MVHEKSNGDEQVHDMYAVHDQAGISDSHIVINSMRTK